MGEEQETMLRSEHGTDDMMKKSDHEAAMRDNAQRIAELEKELETAKNNELALWRFIGPSLIAKLQGE